MIKDDVFIEETPAIELNDYETERNKPMPSFNHSLLQIKLGALLFNQYGDKYQFHSELELDLPNSDRPTLPDICILPKQKIDWVNDIIRVKEPPLTTIEILSPMQNIETLKNKIYQQYFPAGVKSAWLVVPSLKTVSIYSPDGEVHSFSAGTLHDPTNGISIGLDNIFND
jgi:Uma2 family endonuclease